MGSIKPSPQEHGSLSTEAGKTPKITPEWNAERKMQAIEAAPSKKTGVIWKINVEVKTKKNQVKTGDGGRPGETL